MDESEASVQGRAVYDDDLSHRICAQLVASRPRYTTWVASHDRPMWHVARARDRDLQIVSLRLVATQQIHRAALVRHLRDDGIRGSARSRLLAEFYGPLDTECAALAEHRTFTQAVSSQLSATDLLELVGDRYGLRLLEAYQSKYALYFAMHCDRMLAEREGRHYYLASLLPEIRSTASELRQRLLLGPGPSRGQQPGRSR